ncbi:MAG TPA: hypothetical protein VHW47_05450, partial [Acidimicrobiales bacterium]|nr:hypothetical protein [Acidimicrobiales bacterium]
MALDPRTPVLVGAGQVTSRPDPTVPLERRPEPLALMVESLRAAAEDCDGSPAGGGAGPGDRLLRRADSLAVVGSFGWPAPKPGLLVARALGIAPGELLLTGTGGNSPQALLHRAARAIGRGEMEVALVVGAEGMYTRLAARRPDPPVQLDWTYQPVEGTPAPVHLGRDRE